MRVCYDLGEVQRAQGDLDAALATYRQALDTFGESSPTALTGPAHVGLAQVLYERNELTAALDHATCGVTLCRQLAFTPPLATGLAVVARIRQAHGDAAAALEAMGEAGQVKLSPQVVALLNPVPPQRARLLLGPGRRQPRPPSWAKAALASAQTTSRTTRGSREYLVLARVLLAQDRPGPSLALLRAAARHWRSARAGPAASSRSRRCRRSALAARGDHASALGAPWPRRSPSPARKATSGSSPTRARRCARCSPG